LNSFSKVKMLITLSLYIFNFWCSVTEVGMNKVIVCGLFYDTVSSSDCTTPSDRMTNDLWIQNDRKGSSHDLI
jgi:hypothetical protein